MGNLESSSNGEGRASIENAKEIDDIWLKLETAELYESQNVAGIFKGLSSVHDIEDFDGSAAATGTGNVKRVLSDKVPFFKDHIGNAVDDVSREASASGHYLTAKVLDMVVGEAQLADIFSQRMVVHTATVASAILERQLTDINWLNVGNGDASTITFSPKKLFDIRNSLEVYDHSSNSTAAYQTTKSVNPITGSYYNTYCDLGSSGLCREFTFDGVEGTVVKSEELFKATNSFFSAMHSSVSSPALPYTPSVEESTKKICTEARKKAILSYFAAAKRNLVVVEQERSSQSNNQLPSIVTAAEAREALFTPHPLNSPPTDKDNNSSAAKSPPRSSDGGFESLFGSGISSMTGVLRSLSGTSHFSSAFRSFGGSLVSGLAVTVGNTSAIPRIKDYGDVWYASTGTSIAASGGKEESKFSNKKRTLRQVGLPQAEEEGRGSGDDGRKYQEEQIVTSFAKCVDRESLIDTYYNLEAHEGVEDMAIVTMRDGEDTPPLTVPVETSCGSMTVVITGGAYRRFAVGMWECSVADRAERWRQFTDGKCFWEISSSRTGTILQSPERDEERWRTLSDGDIVSLTWDLSKGTLTVHLNLEECSYTFDLFKNGKVSATTPFQVGVHFTDDSNAARVIPYHFQHLLTGKKSVAVAAATSAAGGVVSDGAKKVKCGHGNVMKYREAHVPERGMSRNCDGLDCECSHLERSPMGYFTCAGMCDCDFCFACAVPQLELPITYSHSMSADSDTMKTFRASKYISVQSSLLEDSSATAASQDSLQALDCVNHLVTIKSDSVAAYALADLLDVCRDVITTSRQSGEEVDAPSPQEAHAIDLVNGTRPTTSTSIPPIQLDNPFGGKDNRPASPNSAPSTTTTSSGQQQQQEEKVEGRQATNTNPRGEENTTTGTSTVKDLALTLMFSIAVARQSLAGLLEVVNILLQADSVQASSPLRILRVSQVCAVALLGSDCAADAFFQSASTSTGTSNASAVEGNGPSPNLGLSPSLSPSLGLTVSEKQAVMILTALAEIVSSVEYSGILYGLPCGGAGLLFFPAADTTSLEYLLTTIEDTVRVYSSIVPDGGSDGCAVSFLKASLAAASLRIVYYNMKVLCATPSGLQHFHRSGFLQRLFTSLETVISSKTHFTDRRLAYFTVKFLRGAGGSFFSNPKQLFLVIRALLLKMESKESSQLEHELLLSLIDQIDGREFLRAVQCFSSATAVISDDDNSVAAAAPLEDDDALVSQWIVHADRTTITTNDRYGALPRGGSAAAGAPPLAYIGSLLDMLNRSLKLAWEQGSTAEEEKEEEKEEEEEAAETKIEDLSSLRESKEDDAAATTTASPSAAHRAGGGLHQSHELRACARQVLEPLLFGFIAAQFEALIRLRDESLSSGSVDVSKVGQHLSAISDCIRLLLSTASEMFVLITNEQTDGLTRRSFAGTMVSDLTRSHVGTMIPLAIQAVTIRFDELINTSTTSEEVTIQSPVGSRDGDKRLSASVEFSRCVHQALADLHVTVSADSNFMKILTHNSLGTVLRGSTSLSLPSPVVVNSSDESVLGDDSARTHTPFQSFMHTLRKSATSGGGGGGASGTAVVTSWATSEPGTSAIQFDGLKVTTAAGNTGWPTNRSPVAFAKFPPTATRASFTVVLRKVAEESSGRGDDKITVGVCEEGFSMSGFGSTPSFRCRSKSWGLDFGCRSDGIVFRSEDSTDAKTSRPLRVGDVIKVTADVEKHYIAISVNNGEIVHYFGEAPKASPNGSPGNVTYGGRRLNIPRAKLLFGVTMSRGAEFELLTDSEEPSDPPETRQALAALESGRVTTLSTTSQARILAEVEALQKLTLKGLLHGAPLSASIISSKAEKYANSTAASPGKSNSSPIKATGTGTGTPLVTDSTLSASSTGTPLVTDSTLSAWSTGTPLVTDSTLSAWSTGTPLVADSTLSASGAAGVESSRDPPVAAVVVVDDYSAWLDSVLLAKGVIPRCTRLLDRISSYDLETLPPIRDIPLLSHMVSITDGEDVERENYAFPNFLNHDAPLREDDTQWVLLRQLTDAPNGIGEGLTLYETMKKYRMVTRDIGNVAAPNHVVHATCAALVWHLGYADEALRVVREQAEPSEGLLRAWSESQALRQIYDDSTLTAAASSEDLPAQLPPSILSLQRQFSLNVRSEQGGPLKEPTLAAVRRARLLLSFSPFVDQSSSAATTEQFDYTSTVAQLEEWLTDVRRFHARGGSQLSSGEEEEEGGGGGRGGGGKGRGRREVEEEEEGEEAFHSLLARRHCNPKKVPSTLHELIIDFIKSGPDPDKIRFAVEDRLIRTRKRITVFSDIVHAIASSSSGEESTAYATTRREGENDICETISLLTNSLRSTARADVLRLESNNRALEEYRAQEVTRISSSNAGGAGASSAAEGLRSQKTVSSAVYVLTKPPPSYASSKHPLVHFMTGLWGSNYDELRALRGQWSKVVSDVVHHASRLLMRNVETVQQEPALSSAAVDNSLLSNNADALHTHTVLMCLYRLLACDVVVDDLEFVSSVGLPALLCYSLNCNLKEVRDIAFQIIEKILQRCCDTLAASASASVSLSPAVIQAAKDIYKVFSDAMSDELVGICENHSSTGTSLVGVKEEDEDGDRVIKCSPTGEGQLASFLTIPQDNAVAGEVSEAAESSVVTLSFSLYFPSFIGALQKATIDTDTAEAPSFAGQIDSDGDRDKKGYGLPGTIISSAVGPVSSLGALRISVDADGILHVFQGSLSDLSASLRSTSGPTDLVPAATATILHLCSKESIPTDQWVLLRYSIDLTSHTASLHVDDEAAVTAQVPPQTATPTQLVDTDQINHIPVLPSKEEGYHVSKAEGYHVSKAEGYHVFIGQPPITLIESMGPAAVCFVANLLVSPGSSQANGSGFRRPSLPPKELTGGQSEASAVKTLTVYGRLILNSLLISVRADSGYSYHKNNQSSSPSLPSLSPLYSLLFSRSSGGRSSSKEKKSVAMSPLEALLRLSFNGSSSTIRSATTKILCHALPLIPPAVLDAALARIGCLLLSSTAPTPSPVAGASTSVFLKLVILLIGSLANPYAISAAAMDGYYTSGLNGSKLKLSNCYSRPFVLNQVLTIVNAIAGSPLLVWRRAWSEALGTMIRISSSTVDELSERWQQGSGLLDSSSCRSGVYGLVALICCAYDGSGGPTIPIGLFPGSFISHARGGNTMAESHVVLSMGCDVDSTLSLGPYVSATPLVTDEEEDSPLPERICLRSLVEEQLSSSCSEATVSFNPVKTVFMGFLQEDPSSLKALCDILCKVTALKSVDTRSTTLFNQDLLLMKGESLPSAAAPKTHLETLVFESEHPYTDNLDDIFEVTIPGAATMTVTFDANTKTEHLSDYIVFYGDSTFQARYGKSRYSGGSSEWPGVGSNPPLIIPSGSCVVKFHSDSSVTDWGYKFTVTAEVQGGPNTGGSGDYLPEQWNGLCEVNLMKSLSMKALSSLITSSLKDGAAAAVGSILRPLFPLLLKQYTECAIVKAVREQRDKPLNEPRLISLNRVPTANAVKLTDTVLALSNLSPLVVPVSSLPEAALKSAKEAVAEKFGSSQGQSVGHGCIADQLFRETLEAMNAACDAGGRVSSDLTSSVNDSAVGTASSTDTATISFAQQGATLLREEIARGIHPMLSANEAPDLSVFALAASRPAIAEQFLSIKKKVGNNTKIEIKESPSASAAVREEVRASETLEVTGRVGGYFVLRGGRGFVEESASGWQHVGVPVTGYALQGVEGLPGTSSSSSSSSCSIVSNLSRQLLKLSTDYVDVVTYELLCDILRSWPADTPLELFDNDSVQVHEVAEVAAGAASVSQQGALQLLFKLAGVACNSNGDVLSGGDGSLSTVEQPSPLHVALVHAFKRMSSSSSSSSSPSTSVDASGFNTGTLELLAQMTVNSFEQSLLPLPLPLLDTNTTTATAADATAAVAVAATTTAATSETNESEHDLELSVDIAAVDAEGKEKGKGGLGKLRSLTNPRSALHTAFAGFEQLLSAVVGDDVNKWNRGQYDVEQQCGASLSPRRPAATGGVLANITSLPLLIRHLIRCIKTISSPPLSTTLVKRFFGVAKRLFSALRCCGGSNRYALVSREVVDEFAVAVVGFCEGLVKCKQQMPQTSSAVSSPELPILQQAIELEVIAGHFILLPAAPGAVSEVVSTADGSAAAVSTVGVTDSSYITLTLSIPTFTVIINPKGSVEKVTLFRTVYYISVDGYSGTETDVSLVVSAARRSEAGVTATSTTATTTSNATTAPDVAISVQLPGITRGDIVSIAFSVVSTGEVVLDCYRNGVLLLLLPPSSSNTSELVIVPTEVASSDHTPPDINVSAASNRSIEVSSWQVTVKPLNTDTDTRLTQLSPLQAPPSVRLSDLKTVVSTNGSRGKHTAVGSTKSGSGKAASGGGGAGAGTGLFVGCLVKRGPDWKYGHQDGGRSAGRVRQILDSEWVQVQWADTSDSINTYRYSGSKREVVAYVPKTDVAAAGDGGQTDADALRSAAKDGDDDDDEDDDNSFDDKAFEICRTARDPIVGDIVTAGPDWQWGNQCGRVEQPRGKVTSPLEDGWIEVHWEATGVTNTYRWTPTTRDVALIESADGTDIEEIPAPDDTESATAADSSVSKDAAEVGITTSVVDDISTEDAPYHVIEGEVNITTRTLPLTYNLSASEAREMYNRIFALPSKLLRDKFSSSSGDGTSDLFHRLYGSGAQKRLGDLARPLDIAYGLLNSLVPYKSLTGDAEYGGGEISGYRIPSWAIYAELLPLCMRDKAAVHALQFNSSSSSSSSSTTGSGGGFPTTISSNISVPGAVAYVVHVLKPSHLHYDHKLTIRGFCSKKKKTDRDVDDKQQQQFPSRNCYTYTVFERHGVSSPENNPYTLNSSSSGNDTISHGNGGGAISDPQQKQQQQAGVPYPAVTLEDTRNILSDYSTLTSLGAEKTGDDGNTQSATTAGLHHGEITTVAIGYISIGDLVVRGMGWPSEFNCDGGAGGIGEVVSSVSSVTASSATSSSSSISSSVEGEEVHIDVFWRSTSCVVRVHFHPIQRVEILERGQYDYGSEQKEELQAEEAPQTSSGSLLRLYDLGYIANNNNKKKIEGDPSSSHGSTSTSRAIYTTLGTTDLMISVSRRATSSSPGGGIIPVAAGNSSLLPQLPAAELGGAWLLVIPIFDPLVLLSHESYREQRRQVRAKYSGLGLDGHREESPRGGGRGGADTINSTGGADQQAVSEKALERASYAVDRSLVELVDKEISSGGALSGNLFSTKWISIAPDTVSEYPVLLSLLHNESSILSRESLPRAAKYKVATTDVTVSRSSGTQGTGAGTDTGSFLPPLPRIHTTSELHSSLPPRPPPLRDNNASLSSAWYSTDAAAFPPPVPLLRYQSSSLPLSLPLSTQRSRRPSLLSRHRQQSSRFSLTPEVYEDLQDDIAAKDSSVLAVRFAQLLLLNKLLLKVLRLVDLSSVPDDNYELNDLRSYGSLSSPPRLPAKSIRALLLAGRGLIFGFVKAPLVEAALSISRLPGGSSNSEMKLQISRPLSQKNILLGNVDSQGRWSIFGQIFRRLHGMPSQSFRRSGNLWKTYLDGEDAIDAGGPYREAWATLTNDLMSDYLPLLIPCPNKKHNVGMNRETYVLNPDCVHSETQLQMLVFLGKLMGHIMRSNHYQSLLLAPIVWKLLADEEIDMDDYRGIDVNECRRLDDLRQADLSSEASVEELNLRFEVTPLSGSHGVELHPGGKEERVVAANLSCYIAEVERFRLNEMRSVAAAVREGLKTQIPSAVLSLTSSAELEVLVCGSPLIDADLLQSATKYSSCSASSQHIQWFWEVVKNDFTNDDRMALLRFVWGRSRLPRTRAEFTELFCIAKYNSSERSGGGGSSADECLPASHTCFFTLDLPAYTKRETLKEKLLYAIYNCLSIDGDAGH